MTKGALSYPASLEESRHQRLWFIHKTVASWTDQKEVESDEVVSANGLVHRCGAANSKTGGTEAALFDTTVMLQLQLNVAPEEDDMY